MLTAQILQDASSILAGAGCTFMQAAVATTFRSPWSDAAWSSPAGQTRDRWMAEFSERWSGDVNDFLQECHHDDIADGQALANAWMTSSVRTEMINYCSRYMAHSETL